MNEISKAEMRQRLGNISQLQELLFGEQIEQYNSQIEQHDRAIGATRNKFTKISASY